jgi:hypothetical protein
MSKRKTLAIVSAVAAFAAVSASAASLGALSSTSLGAGTTIVAPCDSDGMVASYTTAYNAGTTQYIVTAVKLTGVNPLCANLAADLTLSDTTIPLSPVVLSTTTLPTLTLVGTTATISIAGTVSAKAVTNLSLVISG